ncbi:hypothetical protein [Thermoactinomyces sp. DSM 45892]|uniref:hypothetical protein n=1 Tax=Thermoactinomyces sp. DSM 45892 TaxID=1882753 RepID=UPI000898F99C|nr:hypothetical protein [Thermoactinomyces sp. DSM 45892]SDZ23629.1 hypothetical protein SAMN05444416_11727 [Thermoactinomyces sp. DSM 45892]
MKNTGWRWQTMLNTIGKLVITVFVAMIPYVSAISVYIQEKAQEQHDGTTKIEQNISTTNLSERE